jgi:two-component system response regulator
MRREKILLVEDSQDDEMLTKRAFQKSRVSNEVIVARDGAEALEYLYCTGRYASRDANDLPEVVLLDLKLPKVDGLEVLRRIRSNEQTRTLPVIILTSSREERDLIAGYQGGANSYIVKPVDPQQFEESIRQLGLYWLVLNEPMP